MRKRPAPKFTFGYQAYLNRQGHWVQDDYNYRGYHPAQSYIGRYEDELPYSPHSNSYNRPERPYGDAHPIGRHPRSVSQDNYNRHHWGNQRREMRQNFNEFYPKYPRDDSGYGYNERYHRAVNHRDNEQHGQNHRHPSGNHERRRPFGPHHGE